MVINWERILGTITIFFVAICILIVPPAVVWAEDSETIDPFAELKRANQLVSFRGFTRSLPHFERAIQAAPERFPIAYSNYGAVLKHRGNCDKAVIIFNAYLVLGDDAEALEEARQGIKECAVGKDWPRISVATNPTEKVRIRINGYLAARYSNLENMIVEPGTYTIEISAVDHFTRTETIEVKKGEQKAFDFPLNMKPFYGTLNIEIDQKDASLRLVPRELYSQKEGATEERTLSLPLEAPEELLIGKYFMEITKDGYHRWIRNIEIFRDVQTDVSVRMSEELPEEIR